MEYRVYREMINVKSVKATPIHQEEPAISCSVLLLLLLFFPLIFPVLRAARECHPLFGLLRHPAHLPDSLARLGGS